MNDPVFVHVCMYMFGVEKSKIKDNYSKKLLSARRDALLWEYQGQAVSSSDWGVAGSSGRKCHVGGGLRIGRGHFW